MSERFKINPIWYDQESTANKIKLLQIYQLAINYASNTEKIYEDRLNSWNIKVNPQKSKVDQLKAKILAHKAKTEQLKKKIRREKLLKEKNKFKSYEKKMVRLRDELLRKKYEQKDDSISEESRERSKNHSSYQSHPPVKYIYVPQYPYVPYMPQYQQNMYNQPQPGPQSQTSPFMHSQLNPNGSGHPMGHWPPNYQYQPPPIPQQHSPMENNFQAANNSKNPFFRDENLLNGPEKHRRSESQRESKIKP